MPGEASGRCDVSADGYSIVEFRGDGRNLEYIGILKGSFQTFRIQREILNNAGFTIFDSFKGNAIQTGQISQSAGLSQGGGHAYVVLQFIDSLNLYASKNSDLGADRRDNDDVSREQLNVMRFVAVAEDVIKIKVGN